MIDWSKMKSIDLYFYQKLTNSIPMHQLHFKIY